MIRVELKWLKVRIKVAEMGLLLLIALTNCKIFWRPHFVFVGCFLCAAFSNKRAVKRVAIYMYTGGLQRPFTQRFKRGVVEIR